MNPTTCNACVAEIGEEWHSCEPLEWAERTNYLLEKILERLIKMDSKAEEGAAK